MGNQPSGAVRVLCPRPLPVLQPSHYVAALAQSHSPVLLAAPLSSTLLLICEKSLSRHSLTTGELLTKVEHSSTIIAACIGQEVGVEPLVLLASGSLVEILSATSLSLVGRLDHSPFPICSVAYYSEGKIFVGLSSGKILQWSLQTQTPTVQYYTEGCTQFLVCSQRHKSLAADHFLAGHSNVVLYQEATGLALQELSRMEGRCLGLDFLDRRNLVLALGTGAVLLGWDALSGNPLFQLNLATTFPQTSLRALVCLPLEQDLLLLCANTGVILAVLTYDFTDMQFTMDIRGKAAMTEAPVVGCVYSSETDTLVIKLDTQGAEALGGFAQMIATQASPTPNLPMFSLHQVPIPPKPEREKRDLPLFDIGLPKSKPQKPIPSFKPTSSDDTLQNIIPKVDMQSKPRAVITIPPAIVLPEGKNSPKDSLRADTETKMKAQTPPKSASEDAKQKVRDRLNGRFAHVRASSASAVNDPDSPPAGLPEVKLETEVPPKSAEDISIVVEELTIPIVQHSEPKPTNEQTDLLSVEKAEKEAEPPAPKVLESAPAPRVETSFERFLRLKKTELLRESPALTAKEVVFKVSEMWGALTEEEQMDFEASAQ